MSNPGSLGTLAEAGDPASTDGGMSAARESAPARARRILLIDDDDLLRQLVRISLGRVDGWEVLVAGSGGEGLEIAAAERPDAILLDVQMPEMDGPATFEKLRADATTRRIPVIFLTADEEPVRRRRFAELGAEAVIAKPFKPRDLAGQVARSLGWSS